MVLVAGLEAQRTWLIVQRLDELEEVSRGDQNQEVGQVAVVQMDPLTGLVNTARMPT